MEEASSALEDFLYWPGNLEQIIGNYQRSLHLSTRHTVHCVNAIDQF